MLALNGSGCKSCGRWKGFQSKSKVKGKGKSKSESKSKSKSKVKGSGQECPLHTSTTSL
jgi:hypothetical protein